MQSDFFNYLLAQTGAINAQEIEVIQSLWSGYGKISRYQLQGATLNTVVVKCISLGAGQQHPRGWNTDISHQRKVKSYTVETNWYQHWSEQCTEECKIPNFIGSFSEGNKQWIILEDLDDSYPLRKHHLALDEVKTCLQWLAYFHAAFLHQPPKGLWEIGTYWHLDTRPDEYKVMEDSALKDKAQTIDRLLNTCNFQTIVHGDAKVANFCFSEDGNSVAAVDFQYVGGGCGMKDVAYFLGSCLTSEECTLYETELLDHYFEQLKCSLEHYEPAFDFVALEKEWRSMYPLACVDFLRFLQGWMPSHQKINAYNLQIMNSVLSSFSLRSL